MQNLFILSAAGEVLIEKHWSGQVKRVICEVFWENVTKAQSPADVLPIISTPKYYLIHVHRFGLFFLSTVQKENSPLLVIETQNRIVDIFLQYFDNKVNESTMREQFSTVYQLLDEMVDGGFPATTEPTQLKEMISPPSLGQKLLDTVTGSFSVKENVHKGDSRIPWRSAGLQYMRNELNFDLVEQVDCIVTANEVLVNCEVAGEVRCKCELTGLPDVSVTFNKPSLIDDASLHRCVRINRFKTERVLSFVPPDGKFKLMGYRVKGVTQLPIYVRPKVDFVPGACKIQVTVGPKFSDNKPVEGVVLNIPFPSATLSHTISCNIGEVKTDPVTKETTWHIGRLNVKDKTPTLEGTVALPQGYKAEERPIIRVQFNVKDYGISGLSIERVSFKNITYKPHKSSRKVTKSGHCEVRC